MLEDANYARLARDTVQAFEAEVEQFPWCFAGMLESIVLERCGGQGIVLVSEDDGNAKGGDIVSKLRSEVGVGRTVVGLGERKGEWIRGRNALMKEMDMSKQGIWVCQGGKCREGL